MDACAPGLATTRRDLQRATRVETKPREIGKSFDLSAPICPPHQAAQSGPFTAGAIWLKVNSQTRQSANLNQMIWSVAEQIAKLSEAFAQMPAKSSIPARRGTSARWRTAT